MYNLIFFFYSSNAYHRILYIGNIMSSAWSNWKLSNPYTSVMQKKIINPSVTAYPKHLKISDNHNGHDVQYTTKPARK
jgi:hypothetical protein